MYDKENAAITAAARPLTFPTGESFQMHPPTDKDASELDHWVQQRYLQVGTASLNDVAYAAIYPKLVQEAITLTWTFPPGSKLLATIDGLSFLCYITCRKSHPEVTPETFRAIIHKCGEHAVREVNQTLRKLSENPGQANAKTMEEDSVRSASQQSIASSANGSGTRRKKSRT